MFVCFAFCLQSVSELQYSRKLQGVDNWILIKIWYVTSTDYIIFEIIMPGFNVFVTNSAIVIDQSIQIVRHLHIDTSEIVDTPTWIPKTEVLSGARESK